jgi:hypothetical protein
LAVKGRSGNPNGCPKKPKTLNTFLDQALKETREQTSSQMSAIPLKADYREIKSKIPKTI